MTRYNFQDIRSFMLNAIYTMIPYIQKNPINLSSKSYSYKPIDPIHMCIYMYIRAGQGMLVHTPEYKIEFSTWNCMDVVTDLHVEGTLAGNHKPSGRHRDFISVSHQSIDEQRYFRFICVIG